MPTTTAPPCCEEVAVEIWVAKCFGENFVPWGAVAAADEWESGVVLQSLLWEATMLLSQAKATSSFDWSLTV
jgi:hypothetical protein